MPELHDLTAVEQVEAIRTGDVSSVEMTDHYLDRIQRLDKIGAFITVLAEHARDAAAAADLARARGVELGLLHGLPISLKDLHPSAGLRTTFGSAAFADLVPPVDSAPIGNLRRAGIVILGKTNAPEFGPTCYTDSAVGGTTLNPYGQGLSPSGSSGGAAAAVAAGFCGMAHGSDGLGSLRTPAANCALVGFKSSRGRVAGSGLDWMALATEGPLARTVADAALFLDAMGGPGGTDLWSVPLTGPDSFRAAASRAPERLRIGRLAAPGPDFEVAPPCLDALERAVAELSAHGHTVEDIEPAELPQMAQVRPSVKTVLSTSLTLTVQALIPADQRHLLMPYTRWLIESESFSAYDLALAQATLRAAAIQYRALFDRYDVLVTPTTTAPPLANEDLRLDDGEECFAAMGRWSAFTPAANIAGVPALSLPLHRTEDGIPIGVQLVGAPNSDERLISLAAEMERAFGWGDVHPDVWYE